MRGDIILMNNNINNKGERIIFIGGAPRSGTSLVQRIMDSHSEIVGGPEFDNIPNIIMLRNQLFNSLENNRINLYTNRNEVDNLCCEFVEDILVNFANRNNCKYISEKTPSNVLHFKELLQVCPKAKFIFVLRDPRAVISSMKTVRKKHIQSKKEKPTNFIRNIQASIHYTEKCINSGFEMYKKYSDRVILIQYEKIIENPELEMKRICGSLNIEYEEGMINPDDNSKTNHVGVGVDGIWYDNNMYFRGIEKDEIEKWKNNLNEKELYLIEKIFSNNRYLKGYNYYHFNTSNIGIIRKSILDLNLLVGNQLKRFIKKCVNNNNTRKILKNVYNNFKN